MLRHIHRAFKRKVNYVINNHPHAFHLTHGVSHVCYFAFVLIQGHGIYAYFAGGLAVLTVLDLLHDEEHHD